jgi:hypothetical protein
MSVRAGATATLELWHGFDTPTGQPRLSHGDYFTLATNASRAEAVAAGYVKVADVALLLVNSSIPDYVGIAAAAAAADVAVLCVSVPSSEVSADRKTGATAPFSAHTYAHYLHHHLHRHLYLVLAGF